MLRDVSGSNFVSGSEMKVDVGCCERCMAWERSRRSAEGYSYTSIRAPCPGAFAIRPSVVTMGASSVSESAM